MKRAMSDQTVKRSDLINHLEQRNHLKHEDAKLVLECILAKIADHLGQQGRIEIRGFGVFQVKHYKPHWIQNPRSGRYLMRPIGIHFKPGKDLRAAATASRTQSESS